MITEANAEWMVTQITAAIERMFGGVFVDAMLFPNAQICRFVADGHPRLAMHFKLINRLGSVDVVAAFVGGYMGLPFDE